MKIVVTGASGLLGRSVYKYFTKEFETIGLCFTKIKDSLHSLDLTDFNKVTEFLDQTNPNVIVHCAAEKRPDVAAKDPQRTFDMNVEASRHLAKESKKRNIILFYISTDYVFDGTHPPYSPSDTPNPLNLYGKTKYEGELAVSQEDPHAIILRVPVLYGKTIRSNESAINDLIDIVTKSQKSTLKMDDYHIRYPTCVDDVAHVLYLVLQKRRLSKDVSGIFHFSGVEAMTKYEVCKIVGQKLNLDTLHILPDSEKPKDPVATRPYDAHLSNDALMNLGLKLNPISFADWLVEYYQSPE